MRRRRLEEVSDAVFEHEITADLPANKQFLSRRLFLNNGTKSAANADNFFGVHVETDY
jgi:hypothetical protein